MKTTENKMRITLLLLGVLLLNGCATNHFFERWNYVENKPGIGYSTTSTGVNVDLVTVRSSSGQSTSYQVITPVR
jgi:hypothetical protein